MVIRAKARQVQHQGLVAPVEDVVRRGVDLVGQVLAAGRRLGSLQQKPGRERALCLEAGEVVRLDAGQLGDRRHGGIIGHGRPLGSGIHSSRGANGIKQRSEAA